MPEPSSKTNMRIFYRESKYAAVGDACLLLFLILAFFLLGRCTVSGDRQPSRSTLAKISLDRTMLILGMYADDSNKGLLPDFRSDRLPAWWESYSGANRFPEGVLVSAQPQFIGKKLKSLTKNDPVLVATYSEGGGSKTLTKGWEGF